MPPRSYKNHFLQACSHKLKTITVYDNCPCMWAMARLVNKNYVKTIIIITFR